MAIIGIDLDRKNPPYGNAPKDEKGRRPYNLAEFLVWMKNYKNYYIMDKNPESDNYLMGDITTEGGAEFNALYALANEKIFYSIFGTDWYYAMSLCIAHYSYLINIQSTVPTGNTGSTITGGGVTRGLMTSASIGGFTKSYDMQYTALTDDSIKFWNQSSYGTSLVALLKTKAIPSIMVVTNGELIPGNPSFNNTNRNGGFSL